MLKEDAVVLTVLGKVKPETIRKVTKNYSLDENQEWFFIDYATKEIPLTYKFDVLLEGENKKLIGGPGLFSLKLLSCTDQLGIQFSSIPEGYKTICKVEFDPNIPDAIRKLPFVDHWKYNPDALSFVNQKDVEFGMPDIVLRDLYTIIFIQIKSTFDKERSTHISRTEFIEFILSNYHTHLETANIILYTLMQLGKVTQKEDNVLELSEKEF